MLRQYTDLPRGLLDAAPTELEELFGGPTLIHLPGLRDRPLFVSVLLHGNETTGIEAMQQMLRVHLNRPLPRALSLFIGNVHAARVGLRRLEGQPDYNRIWPGAAETSSAEAQMMAQVVDQMRQRRVFASIDIHNNTGLNPHYSCVNHLDARCLSLASLFGHTVVYFTQPRGVQSMAFSQICPAVTIECGQPGSQYAAEHAREFVEAALHLAEVPEHPATELGVFQTMATVKIPPDVSFGFGEVDADLQLMDDLQQFNFRELPAGTAFARVPPDRGGRFAIEDNEGQDVAARYFELADGELRTRRHVMPSMLTHDALAIRQDCLCYLMERVRVPDGR
jgi:succinylglutamate desuccinylase